MQMIAEGEKAGVITVQWEQWGWGRRWRRRLNAITAVAFILTITLEQMQIGLIKSKSWGLKKNPVHLTLSWPFHLQLPQLHPAQESFFTSTFWNLPVARLTEYSATGWGKTILFVHFLLGHVRVRKTAFGNMPHENGSDCCDCSG